MRTNLNVFTSKINVHVGHHYTEKNTRAQTQTHPFHHSEATAKVLTEIEKRGKWGPGKKKKPENQKHGKAKGMTEGRRHFSADQVSAYFRFHCLMEVTEKCTTKLIPRINKLVYLSATSLKYTSKNGNCTPPMRLLRHDNKCPP